MWFMMFRQRLKINLVRLYHSSRPQRETAPIARVVSSRAAKVLKNRRHNESQTTVSSYDPTKRFEPFPFAVTEENKIESLKRVVMPLHNIPYDEQLASKESYCRNALRLFARELYKFGTPVRLDVKRLPCHVDTIVGSSVLYGYRNKDEFSIWRGVDGKTITAGHMIFPLGRHGDTVCVEPEGCSVMRDETIELSTIIQEFLREKAQLSVCYSLGTDGGWRRFVIRVNLAGELMLIGVLNPRTLRVGQVLDERDNFKEFIVKRCQEKDLNLVSLYYQPCPHNKCRHQDVPYELLHGQPTIQETIGSLKINLSPDSYIHNSTKGAETLYNTFKDVMKRCFIDETEATDVKPIVLDINCGSGALLLSIADIANQVIGVDNNSQCIDDAKENALLNGIDNCEFICSNIEIVLERILDKYSHRKKNIIVVCDTPNNGLHKNVIDVLRHCASVKKLLMITSKLDHPKLKDNMFELCSKSSARSLQPFAPILAAPVDTCPHIENFQTILAFERLPQ